MKKKIRLSGMLAAFVLAAGVCSAGVLADEKTKSLDVMFVHDTHSHLNEFATVENGESQVLGGFAKLKTLINDRKRRIRKHFFWMPVIFPWEHWFRLFSKKKHQRFVCWVTWELTLQRLGIMNLTIRQQVLQI